MNTPGQNPVANSFVKMLKRPNWITNTHAPVHLNYMWSEIYLWITRTENLNWIRLSHVFQQSWKKQPTGRKYKLNSNEIGVLKEEMTFVKLHKIPSQVAKKNANTDFQCNLSLNLLHINVRALKFRFSGWWFDATGIDYFSQHCPLSFQIGEAFIYKCKK